MSNVQEIFNINEFGQYTYKNLYSKKLIDGTEVGFTKESFFTKANVLVEQFEVYMKKESTNDNW